MNTFFLKSAKPNPLLATIYVSFISCLMATGCQTIDNIAQPVVTTNYSVNDAIHNRTKKNPKEVAQIRTTLAGQYIRQNNLDAATRQLQLAFEADSRYAPAYDMMGVLLQQEGSASNLKEAEKYFKRAIRLDSNFIQAHNNYGVYLSLMKRYPEAAKEFEIAGAALGYTGRVGALENLGRTYLKLNNQPSAINAFARALENNPNSLVARIELVDLLIQENRIRQANRLFEEIKALLGKRPLSPRLMLQGAKLANAAGDMKTRQVYAQELLAAYPLSEEAKLIKKWIRSGQTSWK